MYNKLIIFSRDIKYVDFIEMPMSKNVRYNRKQTKKQFESKVT